MSIIDQGAGAAAGGVARWVGYGLAVIGFALPLAPAAWGGEILAAVALAVPAAVFALLLYAPEAFGATLRGTRTRTISLVLMLPVLSLALTAINTAVLNETYALLPAGVCAAIAVLLGLGAATRPMPGGLIAAIVFLAVFGAAYGYGGLVYADIRFDQAQPQALQAGVQDHYETHGRGGPGYHLVLAPFGPVTRPAKVSVSAATYAALNPGDTACVSLHPGALGMAWFVAGVCPAA